MFARRTDRALHDAAKVLVEAVERRLLLHGEEPDFHINFQPADIATPAGYLADTGAVFGLRTDDLNYGWQKDNSSTARLRRDSGTSDRRLNTIEMLRPGNSWEIAVPNGDYNVRVVAGDPAAGGAVQRVNVEGLSTVRGTLTESRHWFT